MTTLAIEDIYADPHKLDPYIDSGESVAVVRGGWAVAEFVPHKGEEASSKGVLPKTDYKARFLKMWGPGAFASTTSIAAEFEDLRQGRAL